MSTFFPIFRRLLFTTMSPCARHPRDQNAHDIHPTVTLAGIIEGDPSQSRCISKTLMPKHVAWLDSWNMEADFDGNSVFRCSTSAFSLHDTYAR
uniref:AlNc14C62G4526 protein n=1 Tax=Albugo laibachii Nc14 TaxID=890382 RepID=F0WD03_9STRA|nr:AlNc14C62G4526 [Albugo laibachii Nc14]|eukprot:CCA19074.1 AlNc14C62G4526 [Albugo laibachii Nc14]